MFYNIHSTSDRAIVLRTHQNFKRAYSEHVKKTRAESEYGTKAYRDALQRAFEKAKKQIFFNPDMTNFITLTYKGLNHTPEDVLYDVKQFIKNEKRNGNEDIKYIYIMEYQKRGSIHVHMIASRVTTYVNKNGYRSLEYWSHGYSSVLEISDMDENFRPYLYLFKYMRKSQRIGKSFVHSSRNLNNYKNSKDINKIQLAMWKTIQMEYKECLINRTTKIKYYTNYLTRDSIDSILKEDR